MEEDKTDTKWQQKYREAESWFDDVLTTLLRSPFTLGAFLIWTLLAVLFGWWAGR